MSAAPFVPAPTGKTGTALTMRRRTAHAGSAQDPHRQKEKKMAQTTPRTIDWVRTWNTCNNAGGPWVGNAATADYRIDHGDGWATLTVYCNGDHNYGDRVYGTVRAAKAAAAATERNRTAARARTGAPR